MALRMCAWLLAFSLLGLITGCSSGVHDQPDAGSKKVSATSTGAPSSGSPITSSTTADSPKPTSSANPDAVAKSSAPTPTGEKEPALPPVRRGDGTAQIAAAQQAEAAKREKEAEAKPQLTLSESGKTPAADDTLLQYYPSDPDTVNPITSNDNVSNDFQRWVYESLADQDMSDPDILKPALAERWDFDEKNLEFKIYLRKKVKWHPMKLPNGEMLPAKEVTSRDVKFSFDCILNKNVEAASLRSYYEDADAKDPAQRSKIKVTVIDDYTVKVKWSKPYFKIKEFTLGAIIFPRHVYSVDANGRPISFDIGSKEFADGFNNHWANTQMCGTGPMMFKNWAKNERFELVRNPDYWGKPFFFSKVIFRNIPNPNTATEMALQNDLDWAKITEKDRYVQLKKHAAVTSGKVKLVEYEYPGYRYIGYNLRRGEFLKDKQVRWALSHAVPVDTIIQEVFKGLAVRTSGPFQAGTKAYDNAIPLVAFDLEKSRTLLDAAGWRDTDNDGVRDKTIGNAKVAAKFELMIYSNAPSFLTIAEIFKENCRKIGVEMKIADAQWSLMLQRLRKKEFDACMLGWGAAWREDPFQIWHGSQADVLESSNSIQYQNPEVDKLIEQLRVTLDEDKQTPIYHRLHKLIYDDQPYTFLFSELQTVVHDGRLHNIKFYKLRPGIDPSEWYSSSPRLMNTR